LELSNRTDSATIQMKALWEVQTLSTFENDRHQIVHRAHRENYSTNNNIANSQCSKIQFVA